MDDFEQLPKMAGWHEAKVPIESVNAFTIANLKPSYTFSFYQPDANGWANGPCVGHLDFNGPEIKFKGNADESAKVFFDFVVKHFQGRLQEEYTRGYNDAKQGKEPQR
jgi:hypothetical protein